MIFRVILYLFILTIGGLLKYKNLVPDKIFKKVTKIQMFFLYSLILIMGIRIGMDDKIMESIKNIGIKSVIFSILTISFSIIALLLTSKFIIKDESLEGR